MTIRIKLKMDVLISNKSYYSSKLKKKKKKINTLNITRKNSVFDQEQNIWFFKK